MWWSLHIYINKARKPSLNGLGWCSVMPDGLVGGKGIPRGVGSCREKAMWCFLVFQCSTSLIKSSFCPPYPCALESYSFISRIFPLDTCQNKEYGLCISFILLYIRSLSHLNVEPHQRADLSSTPRSALHLGGKSGSAVLFQLLPASHCCSAHSRCAARAIGSTAWNGGNDNMGEVLGRVIAEKNPRESWNLLEVTSEVAKFLYLLLSSNSRCAFVVCLWNENCS